MLNDSGSVRTAAAETTGPAPNPTTATGKASRPAAESPNCACDSAPRSSVRPGVSRTRGPRVRVSTTAAPQASAADTTSGSHSSPSTDEGRPATR